MSANPDEEGARPSSCSLCSSGEGAGLSVSLGQLGAQINAWSWCLGSREQGRAGSNPSQGPSLRAEIELDLSVHWFIELKGVHPRKSWARPHLLPKKVRSQQDTWTHPLPLGSRPHSPFSTPLDLEERSSALTPPRL